MPILRFIWSFKLSLRATAKIQMLMTIIRGWYFWEENAKNIKRAHKQRLHDQPANGVIIITLHFCAMREKLKNYIVCYTSTNHRCYDTILEYIVWQMWYLGTESNNRISNHTNHRWIIPNRLAAESVDRRTLLPECFFHLILILIM